MKTPDGRRRRTTAYGMAGGEPGALGANRVDGTVTARGGAVLRRSP
ncbi:hypothetical protein OG866_08290 [Streptomyces sp. NBC_00663]|nr:hypothetical protein [Streptomyces sp. NBC_00663]